MLNYGQRGFIIKKGATFQVKVGAQDNLASVALVGNTNARRILREMSSVNGSDYEWVLGG